MSAADIGVLDAHVHVWDPRVHSYAWLEDTPVNVPMLPDRYRGESGGAAGVVFVQAADDTVDPVAEARWVDRLDWPARVAIVAGADLAAPLDAVRHQLDELAAVPSVAGVRHLLQDLPVGEFSALLPGLRELSARGGTFDACLRHHQLPALVALLEHVPELVVVVDHIAKPDVDAGICSPEGVAWARGIERLAARAGTFVKLSGLSPESSDPVAFARYADDFLRHALSAFGPARSMVASDWPVSTTFGVGGTVPEWIERVRRLVPPPDWPLVAAHTARAAYLPGGRPRLASR